MGPTDVCNVALTQIGIQAQVSSINPSDGSAEGDAASQLYTPKIQSLMRAANWNFCRFQKELTLLRAVVINGEQSNDPPPKPWLYEYLLPPDCLRARFILPYYNTAADATSVPLTTAEYLSPIWVPNVAVPFIVALDKDLKGNPQKVILTNQKRAILVYSLDLSQHPDLWDPQFYDAATAFLGSWFINALARNQNQLTSMISITRDIVASARVTDGDEGPSNADHLPDWMQVRGFSGDFLNRTLYYASWDLVGFPGGLSF
jgi:hypothetical protein